MTLDQLKVLNIIVKTGSFRAASEQLHRAQSAVSYAIKTLEDELGFSLFHRDSYRPKLTAEGRAIHNKAKAILAQSEEFEVLGKQLSLGTEAVLDISVGGLCNVEEVFELLKGLPKVFPDTQLNIYHEHLRLPLEKVLEDKAVMAISPIFEGNTEVEKVRWKRVCLLPVCAPNFPACEQAQVLSWADMMFYTQIVVMDPPVVKQESTAGVVEGAKRWRVSDFYAMRELIVRGVGWGFLPKDFVESELKRKKLVELNLAAGEEEVDLYLIRKRTRALGPAAQHVWELLNRRFI